MIHTERCCSSPSSMKAFAEVVTSAKYCSYLGIFGHIIMVDHLGILSWLIIFGHIWAYYYHGWSIQVISKTHVHFLCMWSTQASLPGYLSTVFLMMINKNENGDRGNIHHSSSIWYISKMYFNQIVYTIWSARLGDTPNLAVTSVILFEFKLWVHSFFLFQLLESTFADMFVFMIELGCWLNHEYFKPYL